MLQGALKDVLTRLVHGGGVPLVVADAQLHEDRSRRLAEAHAFRLGLELEASGRPRPDDGNAVLRLAGIASEPDGSLAVAVPVALLSGDHVVELRGGSEPSEIPFRVVR